MSNLLTQLGRKVPGSVVVAISILVATIVLTTTAARSDTKASKAIDNASAIGSTVAKLCAGSQGPQIALILHDAKTSDGKPVCDQAGDTLRDPTAAPVVTVNYPDARVVALIRAELAKMPPPASSAPSLEQVTAAVRTVMSSDPVLFKGAKGDPGAPVDQAVIANAVAEYFRANRAQFQGPAGKDGRDGPPGPTVTVTETPPTVTETQTETAPPNDDDGLDPAPPVVTPAPPPETPPEPTATPNSNRRGGPLGGLLNPN